EVNQAAAIIKETAHPDVNLIFGAVIDPSLGDEIHLTVIATGFDSTSMRSRIQHSRFSSTMNRAASSTEQSEDKEKITRRDLAEIGSQLINTDEIEVPAFLRNRNN
ncbi:MAG TPA: cell division protein FtsZ, partial [Anaerolineales bacterium]|nr:cell division protein FtsZ [Anaerolineales bacterium]